jgi:hypothetical protein
LAVVNAASSTQGCTGFDLGDDPLLASHLAIVADGSVTAEMRAVSMAAASAWLATVVNSRLHSVITSKVRDAVSLLPELFAQTCEISGLYAGPRADFANKSLVACAVTLADANKMPNSTALVV